MTNQWQPTPELRIVQSRHSKRIFVLQQKWVEIGPHAVVDPPGPRIIEGQPTGKFEWRDIPVVDEEKSAP